MKTTRFTYALLLGIGSIFSIFHPAKPFPAVGKGARADYENLSNDMKNIGNDFRRAMQQVSENGRT